MNRERIRRWLRDWRFYAISLIIALVITVIIVILTALFKPESLTNPDVGIPIQQEALTNELSREFALAQYEEAFLALEANVPDVFVPAEVEVALAASEINSLSAVAGGNTRLVLFRVVGPGQTAAQIQPAVDASVQGIQLINQYGSQYFPNIDPDLTYTVQEQIVQISVDPYDVPETIWTQEVAEQISPNCSQPSAWVCILEWMSAQRQPSDQSVMGALLTVHQPLYPGQNTHIGAYCRRSLCVISAEDGYIASGYGGWMAAHEFGHGWGARHPNDQTGTPLGYWCQPNIMRQDVMLSITSQTIALETIEIIGLRDVEPNIVADINQSQTVIDASIVGEIVTGLVNENPVQPLGCWTLGSFTPYRVYGVDVKFGNGNYNPAQPTDGAWGGYSEGYTFSLAGAQQPALIKIRVNLNGKLAETHVWYGQPNTYFLPTIFK